MKAEEFSLQQVDLRRLFAGRQELYAKLQAHVMHELQSPLLLHYSGANIYRVCSRIKTAESLLNKINRNGYPHTAQALDLITDIVGARIVCMFQDDLEKIHNYLCYCGSFVLCSEPEAYLWESLPWVTSEEFVVEKKASGYGAIHYIVSLSEAVAGKREIANIKFEIQVRTLMQESWAALEHTLGYKNTVPERIRGYFDSAAELLGVLDKAFQRIKIQKDQLSGEAGQCLPNRGELLTLFTLKNLYFNCFGENPPPGQITEILMGLIADGYQTISEVDRLIKDETYKSVIQDVCRRMLKRDACPLDLLRWLGAYRRCNDQDHAKQTIAQRMRELREYQEKHTQEMLTEMLSKLGEEALAGEVRNAAQVSLKERRVLICLNGEAETETAQLQACADKLLHASRQLFGPITQVEIVGS